MITDISLTVRTTALAGRLIFWLNSFSTNVLLKFIFVAQHR